MELSGSDGDSEDEEDSDSDKGSTSNDEHEITEQNLRLPGDKGKKKSGTIQILGEQRD